jgi:hypothetical protein
MSKNMAVKKTSLYLTDTIKSPLANHIKDGKYKLYIINKESHTKHQIPACLATNYILTSKGSIGEGILKYHSINI